MLHLNFSFLEEQIPIPFHEVLSFSLNKSVFSYPDSFSVQMAPSSQIYRWFAKRFFDKALFWKEFSIKNLPPSLLFSFRDTSFSLSFFGFLYSFKMRSDFLELFFYDASLLLLYIKYPVLEFYGSLLNFLESQLNSSSLPFHSYMKFSDSLDFSKKNLTSFLFNSSLFAIYYHFIQSSSSYSFFQDKFLLATDTLDAFTQSRQLLDFTATDFKDFSFFLASSTHFFPRFEFSPKGFSKDSLVLKLKKDSIIPLSMLGSFNFSVPDGAILRNKTAFLIVQSKNYFSEGKLSSLISAISLA